MSGPFGSSQWMYTSGGFYGFEIENSLRLNDDDSAFLSFTPSSAGNRRTFTFSCWVKRGNLDSSGEMYLFSAGHTDFNNFGGLEFLANEIALQNYNSGTQVIARTGNTLFRDTAAWYNIVWQFDSTQSTAADRTKLYVNGTQITAFDGSDSDLTLNYEGQFNDARQHVIGCRQAASQSAFYDGYITEINFIDGTALTPSSFGETKENIWIPKDTSGLTFGTNGFRLQFKNSSVGSASSSNIGADTSGNDNHFASTNVATTDNMVDTPTDNFCVMNPSGHSNSATPGTLSDGNLVVNTGDAKTITYGTFAIPTSGKYYFEVTAGTTNSTELGLAVRRDSSTFRRFAYRANGDSVTNTTISGSAPFASFTSGDVIGVAVDSDTPDVEFFKNGSSQGSINIDFSLDSGDLFPFVTDTDSSASCVVTFNFGATAFAQTVPSGFDTKLSTANLPAPAIDPAGGENPLEYWDAQLHTGNGGTQEISSFAFQPNWVWIKNRDNADNHYMYDSVRGATKTIHPDDTAVEFTSANALQSFDSDGFTTGSDGGTNRSSQDYVAWAWKAGTSQSFSGESGTSDSTVSSSTEAGFSIVKYTGGSTERVKHGLGAAPEWILVKDLDSASNWAVYHVGLTSDNFLELNGTGAQSSGSNPRFLSSTYSTSVPTSTYFFVRNYSGSTTNNTGNEYIAYCFAPKEGYSKFGSYDDNVVGSDYENTSPFVYTGFRVGWLMIKGTSAGREWVMYDNKRTPDDGVYLRANTNAVEQTDATNHDISFVSNGFKIRGGSGDINTTGESYIYMAFADQPLKFANGGTE